jgi:hypothetical protein
MAKVPEKRYRCCQDFAAALREALGLPPYVLRGSASAAGHPRTEVSSPPAFSGPAVAGSSTAAVLTGPMTVPTVNSAVGAASELAVPDPATTAPDGPSAASPAVAAAQASAGPVAASAPTRTSVGHPAPVPAVPGSGPGQGATPAPAPLLVDLAPGQDGGGRRSAAPPREEPRPGEKPPRASLRRRRTALILILIVVFAVAASLTLYALLAGRPPAQAVSSGQLISVYSGPYLDGPEGIAVAGPTVWITNGVNNSVAELDASDGHLIRTLSGARNSFDAAGLIAADPSHIWIPNMSASTRANGTVTELNASDGSVAGVFNERSRGLDYPVAIADDGRHVWITSGENSLIELDVGTGYWIRTVTLPAASAGGISVVGNQVWIHGGYMVVEVDADNGKVERTQLLGDGNAIVDDGSHVWVTDLGLASSSGSIIELNADNGQSVRTIAGRNGALHSISAIAACRSHIWVANRSNHSSMIELDAGTGRWINAFSNPSYDLNQPLSMAVAGNDLWIANAGRAIGGSGDGSVTELAC